MRILIRRRLSNTDSLANPHWRVASGTQAIVFANRLKITFRSHAIARRDSRHLVGDSRAKIRRLKMFACSLCIRDVYLKPMTRRRFVDEFTAFENVYSFSYIIVIFVPGNVFNRLCVALESPAMKIRMTTYGYFLVI